MKSDYLYWNQVVRNNYIYTLGYVSLMDPPGDKDPLTININQYYVRVIFQIELKWAEYRKLLYYTLTRDTERRALQRGGNTIRSSSDDISELVILKWGCKSETELLGLQNIHNGKEVEVYKNLGYMTPY